MKTPPNQCVDNFKKGFLDSLRFSIITPFFWQSHELRGVLWQFLLLNGIFVLGISLLPFCCLCVRPFILCRHIAWDSQLT